MQLKFEFKIKNLNLKDNQTLVREIFNLKDLLKFLLSFCHRWQKEQKKHN